METITMETRGVPSDNWYLPHDILATAQSKQNVYQKCQFSGILLLWDISWIINTSIWSEIWSQKVNKLTQFQEISAVILMRPMEQAV
jgi:hypothetical protein